MSYDLWFWNQSTKLKKAPEDIVEEFVEGKTVEGIKSLEIDKILGQIIEEFPDAEKEHQKESGELVQIVIDRNKTEDWIILVEWSGQYLCVESHGAPGEVLNQFIDISLEFGCRLYDPQTGTRYDG